MTKLSQTCSRTPGYFVFVFPSRLPLGKICHQRQVDDSIRFDPILISGNRTEKSLRTHNKRLIVFKNLNINNRQSLICTRERCITILCHAIENTVANKINAMYARCMIVEGNTAKYTTAFLHSDWLIFYGVA